MGWTPVFTAASLEHLAERTRISAGRGPELSRLATRQKRTKMTEKKRKLPKFKSDNAERKFWSRHSIEEFGDELADLDVQIRPARTEQIALRLYKDDLKTLKKLAKRRGVGHTTLARSIVEQWLVAKRGTAKRRAL